MCCYPAAKAEYDAHFAVNARGVFLDAQKLTLLVRDVTAIILIGQALGDSGSGPKRVSKAYFVSKIRCGTFRVDARGRRQIVRNGPDCLFSTCACLCPWLS
jgi:hypothetical protein